VTKAAGSVPCSQAAGQPVSANQQDRAAVMRAAKATVGARQPWPAWAGGVQQRRHSVVRTCVAGSQCSPMFSNPSSKMPSPPIPAPPAAAAVRTYLQARKQAAGLMSAGYCDCASRCA
jgi:hypothetical protein